MTRKIAPILHEIVTAIDGTQGAIAGKTFADFQKDWLLRHGAQRAIEIISEARGSSPQAPAGETIQVKNGWSKLMGRWAPVTAAIIILQ